MSKVLISGGSGLIGRHLTEKLLSKGYEVAWLSRKSGGINPLPGVAVFQWDYRLGKIPAEACHFAENVIHLSGANISAKRWTKKRKKELWDSRVLASAFLISALKKHRQTCRIISASAIGYYDLMKKQTPCKEGDAPGFSWLSSLVYRWEKEMQKSSFPLCIVRLGVVLSGKGGIIEKLEHAPLLQPLGSGKQILSWIHIEDVCQMLIYLMEHKTLAGIFNAVAPEEVSQRLFFREFASAKKKRYSNWAIPEWILKLLLGKMAEVLLIGKHICSKKIETTGFRFKYPRLKQALKNL